MHFQAVSLSFSLLLFTLVSDVTAEDVDKALLQGVWVAVSIQTDGDEAPPEAVKQMRFTFDKDKLLIKGNFQDEREETCTYRIDSSKNPKQLDFTPPKEEKPVRGIYRLKEGMLEVCFRNAHSQAGRPTEFSTMSGDRLVLIKFNKAVTSP